MVVKAVQKIAVFTHLVLKKAQLLNTTLFIKPQGRFFGNFRG
jgi:hypothetical protein